MANSWIIEQIDLEISRLQQARQLLFGSETSGGLNHTNNVRAKPTKSASGNGRGKLSPAGRARIVAAQKARWAKLKKSALSMTTSNLRSLGPASHA
jgi:hypothetical protein